ncbi:MAG: hypothetical protein ACMUIU_12515 [bacterium]
MTTKSKLFRIYICIFLTSFFLLCSISSSHARGRFIESDFPQDYLNLPAVGSNVVGYMIGEFRDPALDSSSIHLFVRRCECLRRLAYTSEGFFITYNEYLTRDEFDGILPETLVGMIDIDGGISSALAGESGVIAVIEKVLEYKKEDTRFVARVSIKFVSEVQAVEAEAH